ncbi:MAG: transglutaminase-like domain-containing protein [Clostridia bacterium]|nr:transglutaminase-like domain-containing protein [Clostridia bacterium]
MIEAKKLFIKLIEITFSAFLSFSLIYALTTSLLFDYKPYMLFLAGLLLTTIWYAVFYNKLSLKISGIILGVLTIAGTTYLAATGNLIKLALTLSSFFTWIIDYSQDYDMINKVYQPYLTLIILIIVTLLIYIFTLKKFNFIVILAGGIILFCIQWINNIFVSYAAFYVFLTVILLYYFLYIHKRNSLRESNDYVNKSIFSLWMIPISLIVILICLVFPTKNTPIQFPWLDKKINSVYKYFTNVYNNFKSYEFFSLESTGFGEDGGRLGGKVKLNKTLVMKVESPKIAYLRGGSREVYTGTRWANLDKKQSEIIDNGDFSDDGLFEMLSGPKVLTSEADYMDKYYLPYEIKVSYKNLLLKTLFTPAKSFNLDFPSNKNFQAFVDQNSIITSKNVTVKNFTYKTKAYNIDLNNEAFQDILRESKPGIYDDIINKIDMLNKSIVEKAYLSSNSNTEASADSDKVTANKTSLFYNLSFDELKTLLDDAGGVDSIINSRNDLLNNYIIQNNLIPDPVLGSVNLLSSKDLRELSEISKNIYANYIQLPEKLPLRIKNLSTSITSSQKSNYDKVKAIENYLSKTYAYTLTPKPTPRNRDFVDHFLFESKEGYCTYFATAMAVMVRSIGIPARYVEGYILPPQPTTGNIYSVTNEQAHAWVEVYFEGFGWVPFEPTAPFKSVFYNASQPKAILSDTFSANSSYEEYLRRLLGYGNTDINLNLDPKELKNAKKSDKMIYVIIIALVVIGLMILTLLFLVITNAYKVKYRLFKLKKKEPRNGVLDMYAYYIKALSVLGYPIKTGETPAQFSQRIDSFIVFNKKDSFKAVTEKFMLARYSDNKVTDKDKQLVYSFYESIIKHAKDEMGKYKFFVYRFLLGRI